MIARLRAGLPYKALEDVVKTLGMSREEVARALGISPRTLIRRKQERRLSLVESERVARLKKLLDRAEEIFENREYAVNWMKGRIPALGMAIPLSLLDTETGAREVERVLGRIEHGVFS